MSEPFFLIAVFASFLVAGFSKGVVGLGLPTISLALLSTFTGLPQAIGILLVPSLVTNLWQALAGGDTARIFRKIFPYLAIATVLTFVIAFLFTRVDNALVSMLFGLTVVIYALVSLVGFRLPTELAGRRGVMPGLAIINGIVTGLTGSFIVPGLMYLQTLGLQRPELLQAMGMLFGCLTIALTLALFANGTFTADISLLSVFALVPTLLGMYAGRQLSASLPEARFRRVLFLSLLALGTYLVVKQVI